MNTPEFHLLASSVIVQAGGVGGFSALTLLFLIVFGLIALVVVFGLAVTVLRNLPLWLFDNAPYLVGFFAAGFVWWTGSGWIAIAAFAGAGVGFGILWSALIDRQVRRSEGWVGRIHKRLLKHASR